MKANNLNWNELEQLDDKSFSQLIEATVAVLQESESERASDKGLKNMPEKILTKELLIELNKNNIQANEKDVNEIIHSRDIIIDCLKEIAQDKAIAQEIEKAYYKQKEMLVVDAGLISAAALLILCVRIRKIDIGNKVIEFDKIKVDILESLKSFLNIKP